MTPRKHCRITDYDYATPGYYFITLCTYQRSCILSSVNDDQVQLLPAGKLVNHWLDRWLNKYPNISIDSCVIMPNHLHLIVVIEQQNEPLSKMIRWLKAMSANHYRREYQAKLWQRNYFEHIIRRIEALDNIRRYIENNPKQWDLDHDNPVNFLR